MDREDASEKSYTAQQEVMVMADRFYIRATTGEYYRGMSETPRRGRNGALVLFSLGEARTELDMLRSAGYWPLYDWRIVKVRAARSAFGNLSGLVDGTVDSTEFAIGQRVLDPMNRRVTVIDIKGNMVKVQMSGFHGTTVVYPASVLRPIE